MRVKCVWQKVSDDENTRRARSMRDSCDIELSYNEITVLFLDFITDGARRDAK